MYKEKVLELLKPKVKAFGFNKTELEGIAEHISNNLSLEDNASDDDVNAAIDKAIEAVLPFFSAAQSQANRAIEKYKKEHPAQDDNNKGGDDSNHPSHVTNANGKGDGNGDSQNDVNNGKNDDGKALAALVAEALKPFTAKIDALTGELNSMKVEKTTTTRKQRLEKLLENSGAFGTRTLKNFTRMTFNNDDEFDEFYADVESDLKAYNQERADAGLQQLGVPPSRDSAVKPKEVKPLTEQEIKDLVDSL